MFGNWRNSSPDLQLALREPNQLLRSRHAPFPCPVKSVFRRVAFRSIPRFRERRFLRNYRAQVREYFRLSPNPRAIGKTQVEPPSSDGMNLRQLSLRTALRLRTPELPRQAADSNLWKAIGVSPYGELLESGLPGLGLGLKGNRRSRRQSRYLSTRNFSTRTGLYRRHVHAHTRRTSRFDFEC